MFIFLFTHRLQKKPALLTYKLSSSTTSICAMKHVVSSQIDFNCTSFSMRSVPSFQWSRVCLSPGASLVQSSVHSGHHLIIASQSRLNKTDLLLIYCQCRETHFAKAIPEGKVLYKWCLQCWYIKKTRKIQPHLSASAGNTNTSKCSELKTATE